MKRIISLLILLTSLSVITHAAIGTWRTYMAYGEIQEIAEASEEVFVLSSGNLFSYNPNDGGITEYNKVNGLSDVRMSHISWNKSSQRLVAIYANSNIDIISEGAEVTNLSAIYDKTMTDDKTIFSIYNYGQYAYLSTGFGIIRLNVRNNEVSATYNLGRVVTQTAISNNVIYARLKDGNVLSASLSSNLLDKSVWQPTTSYDPSIFNIDTKDWDKWYPTISTLQLDAPRYNNFGFMKMYGGKLYTCGGGYNQAADMMRPGTIQVMEHDGRWTFFEDHIDTITGYSFVDINCLDIDPQQPAHIFAGGRTGIYEFLDGHFVKAYTNDNSPLQTASTVPHNDKNYVLAQAVKFDADGDLWCFNSIAPSQSLISYNSEQHKWTSHHNPQLMYDKTRSLEHVSNMILSHDNQLWFCNNHWRTPSLYRYYPTTDDLTSYTRFVNEDGSVLTLASVKCMAEDKDGNMWVGTSAGPLLLTPEEMDKPNPVFEQVKVPRQDGSGLADYLLNGVSITAIAIDGSGRKWFASETNGVYLISEDNYNQIYHFTRATSPLLSDNIESLVINDESGEVFFGTDAGLCSFVSDATRPEEKLSKDKVWAYPNPVSPEYTGLITIVGLTLNAQVKITTPTGVVVAEGISNGGTFTWDGTDRHGRRVASGVYSVLVSTESADDGVVCKVAVIK